MRDLNKDSKFTITKISIIESLPADEVQTGTELARYIEGLEVQDSPGIQTCRITSKKQLIQFLLDLEAEAHTSSIPLIHFETHGSWDRQGLVTANLDFVSWAEISEILHRINLATGFNLMVFVAACNGGYFLEEMKVIRQAPCFALVAPTEEVDPGEILRAGRDFYRILLRTSDATKAISILVSQRVQQGRWFAHTAESWYRMVVLNHIQTWCTPKVLKERAREMSERARVDGIATDIGRIKRQLKAASRVDFVGKYFDRFFCLDSIPENALRFEYARKKISSEISQLLSKQVVSG